MRSAGPFQLRSVCYDPGYRMAFHAHRRPSVSLVLSGGLRETVGRMDEAAGPLSVVVKPAGIRHADAFGPRGARTLQIAWTGSKDTPDSDSVLAGGWRWCHLHTGVREFVALVRAMHAGAETGPSLESRVWDVFAALDPHPRGGRGEVAPPRWLVRVREELDDRITEPVEVRELAARAGIHPGSLTRAFRRHFGESVTGYRGRERMRRAARALAEAGDSVSRIAHATGFADHAHLSREFRRRTGIAPTEYRSVLASNDAT